MWKQTHQGYRSKTSSVWIWNVEPLDDNGHPRKDRVEGRYRPLRNHVRYSKEFKYHCSRDKEQVKRFPQNILKALVLSIKKIEGNLPKVEVLILKIEILLNNSEMEYGSSTKTW